MSKAFNLNDLKKAENANELHEYGELEEVVKAIKKDPCMCSREITSWDEAFSALTELKKFDCIFVSDNAKYVFALSCLEGKTRNHFIALTDDLYDDKEKAEKWYKALSKKVHPDQNPDNQELAQKAFSKLQELYSRISKCFTEDKED